MSGDRLSTTDKVPVVEITPDESARLYRLARDFPGGAIISLTDGEYSLSATVVLPSNTSIRGAGAKRTRIVLEKGSNCHLFTNSDHRKGNENLAFSGFSVDGNGGDQHRPLNHKPLTFCCGVYLRRVASVRIEECSFFDVRQTAAHFSECRHVVVREFQSQKLGWSGVSTSGTSDIWVEAIVEDAGRDQMHSAIHMDGGLGVYVDAVVSKVTGNGIMLDSAYAPLTNCVVKGSASSCLRGVSLSGSAVKELRNVYIEGLFTSNTDVGVMISNSQNVVIARSLIHSNGHAGIRFQGRNGGRDCLVLDTIVADNPAAYEQLHASGGNWIFGLPDGGDGSAKAIRQRSLADFASAFASTIPPRPVSPLSGAAVSDQREESCADQPPSDTP